MNKQKDMSLTFEQLIASIRQVHDQLAAQAGRAVNISLTLRNWAIGHYIHEYEQNGSDRAQYGERLLGGEFSPPTEKRELPTPELHNSGRAIITKTFWRSR